MFARCWAEGTSGTSLSHAGVPRARPGCSPIVGNAAPDDDAPMTDEKETQGTGGPQGPAGAAVPGSEGESPTAPAPEAAAAAEAAAEAVTTGAVATEPQ